ncbi:hypothetical protein RaK2_00245 [Klebsiella phage vB_KleM_RaK2]|uniref:Uncharacterized protein n=1 Tax=Klebsiella phage vB_KleM_RaK2 TaxID=1147094 RepID=H6X452_9CAUD|nr:hypothetical protein F403_gp290 [Klebsiella phage vB_KleM_RaK2]AFA44518.1 hypothetical protein RaK2_00245 [Klebsiella phage vB_KleM_RaK2]
MFKLVTVACDCDRTKQGNPRSCTKRYNSQFKEFRQLRASRLSFLFLFPSLWGDENISCKRLQVLKFTK